MNSKWYFKNWFIVLLFIAGIFTYGITIIAGIILLITRRNKNINNVNLESDLKSTTKAQEHTYSDKEVLEYVRSLSETTERQFTKEEISEIAKKYVQENFEVKIEFGLYSGSGKKYEHESRYNKSYEPSFDSFVAIDFETTGLRSSSDAIIEIGAVKFENGKFIDYFNSLVNPKITIPLTITKITGITNDMVENAPIIEQILPDFIDYIADYPLVAHNASFDMGFLLNNANKEIKNPVVDTLQLSRNYFPPA